MKLIIKQILANSLHPDTRNYLQRVSLVGGSVAPVKVKALDSAIKNLYANNLRGSANYLKYWLCLNLTESFTGCLVAVYDDGVGNATNYNFVSGDWTSQGLKGNGSNKYLNSGWNPATSLGTFSNAGRYDVHMSAWVTDHGANASIEYGGVMGGGNNGDDFIEMYAYFDSFFEGQILLGDSAYIATTPQATGFHLLNRLTGGAGRLVVNGYATTDAGLASPIANPNYTIPFFAMNEPVGTIPLYGAARVSNFTMGAGLTTTQEVALYNILQSLN